MTAGSLPDTGLWLIRPGRRRRFWPWTRGNNVRDAARSAHVSRDVQRRYGDPYMRPVFVLLHSPALGPRSWQAVATALGVGGEQVVVPSLAGVARGDPPYWPLVLDAVHDHLRQTNPDRPAVLVPHSNAGVFVPLLATGLETEVRGLWGSIFRTV